ncbi:MULTISPECIES: FAD-binding oxidoreductase [Dickeya]|uniref:Aclacinomycin oxidoreductase n=2 Tax=Dickeya TaxID=204037 RepID=A0A375A7E4_9GAMM|nr:MULTISPECIES: FAD-binding protein [Dickeya]WFN57113.1 FAD-binding protein [Dickeya lacustris]SLM61891.1 Aclacinomycin oxidoreductase [Dickeya aquatica]
MTIIEPNDSRYLSYITGMNQRWRACPAKIVLPGNTQETVQCIDKAVEQGLRISVRAGGYGYQDFACHADVDILIDVSDLDEIAFDPDMGAIAVGAGATLSRTYEVLYRRWNVTLPGGPASHAGMGGHVCGGGFGLLSRRHGLTVDHLYAIEVVTVDSSGKAHALIARRDRDCPNHDLWWAHAGGGGGQLGIVTKFWFRSPTAQGNDPAKMLPGPPAEVYLSVKVIPWESLGKRDFSRLMRNYGAWYMKHQRADSPESSLAGYLVMYQKAQGVVALLTQMDASVANAEAILAQYHRDIFEGIEGVTGFSALSHLEAPRRLPWLKSLRLLGSNSPSLSDPTLRGAYKSAYMRQNFPEQQTETLYRYLTTDSFTNKNAMVMVLPYGGAVNEVAPDATAVSQRDSVMKVLYQSLWADEKDDRQNLDWIRQIYHSTYADTGGVPVSNHITDGCFINYPDADLNDLALNTSGVTWAELYFKDNYPRLQEIKAKRDPLNIFRHRQSVEPAKI